MILSRTYKHLATAFLAFLGFTPMHAQEKSYSADIEKTIYHANNDSLLSSHSLLTKQDSLALMQTKPSSMHVKRDWNTWRPQAKKALWLALVVPGAGQIYNRKYWKLPLVYGGFVGCLYALRWNNQMFHDYSQAYIDITDNNPQTKSYESFLHLGREVTADNLSRYQNIFRQRKDKYRKWRDMSIFSLIAVYALSVIDAYVDASLSEFDISKDLSLQLSPTMINKQNDNNPFKTNALGLQCRLTF